MFISNSQRFIFIHIPKTAGTSITYALESSFKWNDIVIGSTESGKQIAEIYRKKGFKLRKHSPATKVREVVGEDKWNDYFTFTFVRHPYTRTLSLYTYMARLLKNKRYRIKQYLHNLPIQGLRDRDPVWQWPATRAFLETRSFSEWIRSPLLLGRELGLKPQTKWIVDRDKNVIVDFVGKTEDLKADFDKIAARVGLESIALETHNPSGKPQKKERNEYFRSEDDYEYLYQLFQQDFEVFGYDSGLRL